MKVIGFDFGTTNSTISYYDAESKSLDSFRLSASANDYIPTVISYSNKKENDVSIGITAKGNLTSKSYETYENFKLRLGRNFNEIIEGKTKTPIEVARDFITKLLATYKSEQHIDDIECVVMTVPETWFKESSNQTARENIEGIYTEIGFSDFAFQLESEPVAAAAYFCWAYNNDIKTNPKTEKYNGFITVVDYGGGTLDVTLCEVVNGDNIKILERCGFGEYNETNGCAGVAFDEAVIEKVIKDNDLSISKDSPRFLKFRNSFEERKIAERDKITESLGYYYDDPAIMEGEVLFSLEYNDDGDVVDIFCEDLVECFNRINAPVLSDSLNQTKQFFDAHKIDSSAQGNFRVLLVGGFSNFYSVEAEVRKFFGSNTERIDKRFEQPFQTRNRSLAISRGAALIAQKVIKVDHTCTHNIGYIVVARDEQDRWIDKDVLVINKGEKLSEVKEAVFSEATIQVRHKSGVLRIFMDDGRPNNAGRIQAALDESVRELFPNVDNKDNEYKVGFSVNKNLVPTIHIRDKSGVKESRSLNKLLERISIMQK